MMRKIFSLCFCLGMFLLILYPGQNAFSADPLCENKPPTGYGGTCKNITCGTTAGTTPLDTLAPEKHDECLAEYLSANSTMECEKNKCGGTWDRICCREKGTGTSTCTAPNTCVAATACIGEDKLNDACSEATKVCCKPKCEPANCNAECSGTLTLDKSKSATGCTDPKKTICCMPTGGTTEPKAPTTTDSASFPLAPLSPVGDIDVPTLIGIIVKGVLGIVGSIALIMFVYGGFLMLISEGDPGKVKKGKDAMVWAVAGLAVIFGSYIFVSFIISRLSMGK